MGVSSCSAHMMTHDARICGSTADEKDVRVCNSGRPTCEHLEEARDHPCDHYTADKTEHPPSGDCRTDCKLWQYTAGQTEHPPSGDCLTSCKVWHYTAGKTEHPPSGGCLTGCKRCSGGRTLQTTATPGNQIQIYYTLRD